MSRALGRSLLVLAAWVACCAAAEAKELPAAVRRMAERAFLQGRLGDLDDILAGATTPQDRLPLYLRDVWWRRQVPTPAPPDLAGADALTAARVRWIHEGRLADWPLPGGGAEDPYPILTALVEDCLWRASRGTAGLPEDGPLEALSRALDPAEERRAVFFLGEWTRDLMRSAYGGPQPYPEQAQHEREAADLRARNARLAWIALAAFALAPLLVGLIAFRRRPSWH